MNSNNIQDLQVLNNKVTSQNHLEDLSNLLQSTVEATEDDDDDNNDAQNVEESEEDDEDEEEEDNHQKIFNHA